MKTFSQEPRGERAGDIPCPLCGSTAFRPGVWDAGTYSFGRCRRCGVFYQNPQPLFDDLQHRYDEGYCRYEVERGEDFLGLMKLALEDIGFSFEGRLPGRFLDIGCATGLLVREGKNHSWESLGVELCDEAAEYGRRNYGVDIRTGTLEEAAFSAESFDVVHASHLIEHLNQPGVFLEEVSRILKPGGQLILTTPNADGLQARLLKGNWRSAIADHLVLFSRRTLKELLAAKGFQVEKERTWGGLGVGVGPRWLKRILDKLAKPLGFGDVMVLSSRKK